jgi:hypothetical protein
MSTNPSPDLVRRATRPLALLQVYFHGSVDLGDCSSMGIILDRLETYSERRGVCRRCKGTGLKRHKELTAWLLLAKEFAERFPDSKTAYEKLNPPPSSEDCPRCHGTRSVIVSGYTPCPVCKGKLAWCVRCSGAGRLWRGGKGGEITARPTGSSKELSSGREPNYDSIIELARAGRVMAAVPSEHRLVLETFHGHLGDHCEGLHGNRTTAVVLCVLALPDHVDLIVAHGDREQTVDAADRLRATLEGATTSFTAIDRLREFQTHPETAESSKVLERAARSLVESATDAWVSACEDLAA